MQKLPTGEPYAGKPPVRFGGRGRREPIPTPIVGLQIDQLLRKNAHAIGIATSVSPLDLNVVALPPTQILQHLRKRKFAVPWSLRTSY
jgi:hypothetical protein